MFSLRDYGDMLGDAIRTRAYLEALRRVVKPGAVVLDIGTGTGVFALQACRLGARRVFAVESDDAIELAREIARANGFGDRIEFVQALSTDIDLPERVDVIVADLHGILPYFQGSVVALADARRRFLAPEGAIIPRRETIWGCAVAAPQTYARLVSAWQGQPYGFDMDAVVHPLCNEIHRAHFEPGQLVAEPAEIAHLDYPSIEETDLACDFALRVERDAASQGLALWFDSSLCDGVALSNAPGQPKLIYANAFLPWPAPVQVREGDSIEVSLRAQLLGPRYLWSWTTRVVSRGRENASFRQSQFFAAPIAAERLRRQGASHVARLGEQGRIDRLVLERMGEARSLGEIAHELAALYPARFARWQDALAHVGELSLRCGD